MKKLVFVVLLVVVTCALLASACDGQKNTGAEEPLASPASPAISSAANSADDLKQANYDGVWVNIKDADTKYLRDAQEVYIIGSYVNNRQNSRRMIDQANSYYEIDGTRYDTFLGDGDLDFLRDIEHLTSLSIEANYYLSSFDFISELHELTKLAINSCGGVVDLHLISNPSIVESLDIDNAAGFDAVGAFINLSRLDIGFSTPNGSTENALDFSGLSGLKSLRFLDVPGFMAEDLKQVDADLTALAIYGKIGDIAGLEQFSTRGSLEYLDVKSAEISDMERFLACFGGIEKLYINVFPDCAYDMDELEALKPEYKNLIINCY